MRVVVALGGNALARRGEPMTADRLRANVRATCQTLAGLAGEHELVITHGNGPQVGLLALQNLAYSDVAAYPLDILGAETQGMIGYVIQQELSNALAGEREVAGVLTTTVVNEDDPAFDRPTKLIGPQYSAQDAARPPPSIAGRSLATVRHSVGWCPPPTRSGSCRLRWSNCCWRAAGWWSASAVAAYR